ncbi:hypothetical protein [Methylomonas rosea]|uniref:Uncharacterized protein n=1 Tax=Methylomonas rosea TaxID=2952227 RepID=A0ABT1TNL4_9GAMM|nr:hypothetical protein [Methylomonas sp. WSC-7]MCQ8116366.1 hypothetical protein [Methylomonas sp. WSC-7]
MADSRKGGFNPLSYKACCLSVLFSIWVYSASATAELLGTISDETAPVTKSLEPKASKNDDRKIIYRVICSPDDQDLPDCDRSAVDDGNETALLPMPDLPPDSADLAEQSAQTDAAKVAAEEKPQKSVHKKAAKPSKSAKKTAAKKPDSKKKPRK